ncbi:MAG TPA: lanthionine synthetase LanC family protein [Microlunatus sp.]|nr:lanthionine synthetase LanC family protein [Microlunatus sp.]
MTTARAAATADTEFAAAARRLAARLASLAEPDPRGAPRWSGDDVDPARSTEQQVVLSHDRLDDGLLTGRVGIAAALAAAARLPAGRPEWSALAARTAWSAVVDRLSEPRPSSGLGWCSGWLGIARGARLVAEWTGDDRLAAAARLLAGRAVDVLAGDPARCPDYPDLLDGLAGHLGAVLAADLDRAGEPARRAAATGLLDRLLAQAVTDSRSGEVRWPMAGTRSSVIGLAHGGSGVTVALAAADARDLSATTGIDLSEVIDRTLRWEDGHFRAEVGGWPDLRAGSDVPGLAWCHGAPGVGVAAAYRARVGCDSGTEETYVRARAIVQQLGPPTATGPFDGTLCHGLAGLVELHLAGAEAWPVVADEHLADARLLARHLTRAGRDGRPGWTCGVRGGRTPTVLTGLAGVAYTLVRCHDPALAPSLAHPGLPAAALAVAAG